MYNNTSKLSNTIALAIKVKLTNKLFQINFGTSKNKFKKSTHRLSCCPEKEIIIPETKKERHVKYYSICFEITSILMKRTNLLLWKFVMNSVMRWAQVSIRDYATQQYNDIWSYLALFITLSFLYSLLSVVRESYSIYSNVLLASKNYKNSRKNLHVSHMFVR